jgi:hypothetical protein
MPLEALQLRPESRRRWHGPGLTRRGERVLNALSAVVVALLAVGWGYSVATLRQAEARNLPMPDAALTPTGRAVTTALTNADAPTAAYVEGAAVEAMTSLRGRSGKLRARIQPTGEPLPSDANVVVASDGEVATDATPVPSRPGLWRVGVAVGKVLRPVADFNVIALHPFAEKRQGRIGQYLLGSWPGERGAVRGPARAPASKYANPAGFIEVTRDNQTTRVSEHFKLQDFLTHNQPNVWPKYLVLRPELVDKLELVLNDLQRRGVKTAGVRVMSGFRTPSYNAGGGNTGGRANLSRHMYGDASDIFIDNDGNGNMDDLNGDGRVDIGDSRFILESVERVERAHPELVGGAGVYVACCGHGPFIHIDTRGYRARWVGTGSG